MSGESTSASELVLGGSPRVELMPPEVTKRVKAQSTRRLLVLVLVLALVAVGGGYAAATLRNLSAQAALAAAQAETTRLLTDQQTYLDAALIADAVEAIEEAREIGTSTQFGWQAIYNQVRAVLPPGAVIDMVTFAGPPPWGETAAETPGPLVVPGLATVTMTVMTASVPDAAALLRALATVTGFADATIQTATGPGTYVTTLTLTLDEAALAANLESIAAEQPDDMDSSIEPEAPDDDTTEDAP